MRTPAAIYLCTSEDPARHPALIDWRMQPTSAAGRSCTAMVLR
ncbi:hypothetical protein [Streptomyces sp. Y1]|uniref:Uncharacterized protein n=1 Tax=Streptomyces sp. Y1 TaxID=3238634 RepID=A0AB39TX15_9ACTN